MDKFAENQRISDLVAWVVGLLMLALVFGYFRQIICLFITAIYDFFVLGKHAK